MTFPKLTEPLLDTLLIRMLNMLLICGIRIIPLMFGLYYDFWARLVTIQAFAM